MPVLDFNEIPSANISDGRQDTFEKFARDFFELLGFEIESGPDRGQDGGRDLIIIEKRRGVFDSTKVRWLVSCKHKSHSGQSVRDNDEVNISDRVRAHNCAGFLGFYSTIMSAPLSRRLMGLNKDFEINIFDNEKIETTLLNINNGYSLIRRYFPESYEKISNKKPSNLFSEYQPLECRCCERDLLSNDALLKYDGIIAFVEDRNFEGRSEGKHKFVDIYWSCKGECDDALRNYWFERDCSTKWEDISDIVIPYRYLQWNMAILNRLEDGTDSYSEEAFDKLKLFIMLVSQIVLKNQSQEDIQRILDLSVIPEWL